MPVAGLIGRRRLLLPFPSIPGEPQQEEKEIREVEVERQRSDDRALYPYDGYLYPYDYYLYPYEYIPPYDPWWA